MDFVSANLDGKMIERIDPSLQNSLKGGAPCKSTLLEKALRILHIVLRGTFVEPIHQVAPNPPWVVVLLLFSFLSS